MMTHLSSHDSSILKALFDPEASPSGAVQIDTALGSLPHMPEPTFAVIRSEEQAILRPLNNATLSHDTIRNVIQQLTALIHEHPTYPSAYVNRAQATRLLLSVNDLFTSEHSHTTAQLLQDLGEAIDHATPSTPHQAVSEHQAKVLAAAHTHRGFLLLKATDLARNGIPLEGASEQLRSASADQIEELASRDFAVGGRYGDKMAQQMSVKTNPYAKMCGAIVKEAMRKEMVEGQAMYS